MPEYIAAIVAVVTTGEVSIAPKERKGDNRWYPDRIAQPNGFQSYAEAQAKANETGQDQPCPPLIISPLSSTYPHLY